MKVLSLFDGISCARVALERLGYKDVQYFASEVDKYAIQIAQKNYPDTVQLGGVIGLHPKGKFDLLIGGSPCQDLSIAKKGRKGLDGERSGLFWEYVRILKEVKPRYFVLENVNSMPKKAKAIITEALGVEPIMIDAAFVSAQRRKRLFWTNIPGITQPEDRGIFLKDILEYKVFSVLTHKRHILTERRTEEAKKLRSEYMKKTGKNFSPRRAKELTPREEMKEKSNPLRLGGRGYAVGDKHEWDSVYQYRRTYWRETKGGKVPTLTANMGTGGHNVPFVRENGKDLEIREATKKGFATAKIGDSVDMSFPNSATRRGRVGNKAKNIMTSQSIGVYDGIGIRKLTPTECERLQSLPDNYTEGVNNTQRYKALGNAFNVEVVRHILSFIPRA